MSLKFKLSISLNIILIFAIIVVIQKDYVKRVYYSINNHNLESMYIKNKYYKELTSYFPIYDQNSHEGKIIFLGDSHTSKFLWHEALNRNDILNRGIGSDTTYGILQRIEEIVSLKPKQIFIMAGANDKWGGGENYNVY